MSDDGRPIEYTADYRYAYLRQAVDWFLVTGDRAFLVTARDRLHFIERARAVADVVHQAAGAEWAR